jgi:hydroxyethylthiazole kinase-like uncharacterized protein yjeF
MNNPSFSDLLHLVPQRKQDSHKADFGHVLIVGGNVGMLGSVILAAQGGCAVGAGLVTVATHPDHAALVSVSYPNVMSYGIKNASQLRPLLNRASVVVMGMGLGQDSWALKLFKEVLKSNLPLVVDADGLNLLTKEPGQSDDWILTPHPGEAARLLQTAVNTVQTDRFSAAMNLQKNYGGVVVLKGAGTIIQGEADQTIICKAGNSGMSTGGMGDLLSGMIGGLLAQDLSLFDAASLAVYLHAYAGDLAKDTKGERGLLPQELSSYVRCLLKSC